MRVTLLKAILIFVGLMGFLPIRAQALPATAGCKREMTDLIKNLPDTTREKVLISNPEELVGPLITAIESLHTFMTGELMNSGSRRVKNFYIQNIFKTYMVEIQKYLSKRDGTFEGDFEKVLERGIDTIWIAKQLGLKLKESESGVPLTPLQLANDSLRPLAQFREHCRAGDWGPLAGFYNNFTLRLQLVTDTELTDFTVNFLPALDDALASLYDIVVLHKFTGQMIAEVVSSISKSDGYSHLILGHEQGKKAMAQLYPIAP